MSEFLMASEADPDNCGNCDHRTCYLGFCVKKGKKVSRWEAPCPMYLRRVVHA